ncbi:MAG TPA: beta-ketoacyl synthase chain length factor [Usitatibacter sp.]|jgi:hypothetical protein|nr:beta-ketoacyl synthase chain length factor [Usitatibacter sp.]
MTLGATVEGIGLVGPGLAGWSASRERLAGREAFAAVPTVIPLPEALPATERRRAGKTVRLALAAGLEAAHMAGREARSLATIFASSGGESENCHAICEALAGADRLISPTRFHNSVHNAAAGYWGIATGAMAPADAIGAFDASFAAGLLEALVRLAANPAQAALLIAYDTPYPEPLHGARPIADSFATAFVLSSDAARGPRIEARIEERPAARMDDASLERVRAGIPAARSLPLLRALARNAASSVSLEYVDGQAVRVELRP